MGFSRREYWSGLPGPPPGVFLTQGSKLCVLCLLLWPVLSPGDLPNLGIEPQSPTLKVDSLWSEPPGKPLALAGGFFTTSTTWETPDLSVNPVSFTLLSSYLPNVNALPCFTVQDPARKMALLVRYKLHKWMEFNTENSLHRC